jgi:hypothetical protein
MLPWVVVAGCAMVSLGSFALWKAVNGVLEENHLIESSQAAFLALAAGLHLVRIRSATILETASYHATLALLSFSLLLREMDIDRFGTALFWRAAELVLRGGVAVLWFVVAWQLWRHRSVLFHVRRRILFSPCSLIVWAAIGLYGISWFFDKSVIPLSVDTSRFFEETIQLNATWLLAVAALLAPGPERLLSVRTRRIGAAQS